MRSMGLSCSLYHLLVVERMHQIFIQAQALWLPVRCLFFIAFEAAKHGWSWLLQL